MNIFLRDRAVTAILWFIAAAMVLFAFLFHTVSYKPAGERLAALENEYSRKRAGEEGASRGAENEDKELMRLYEGIPEWEDFTRVMGEVYKTGERLNLLVESASYHTSIIKGSGLVSVTVTMPVTGSYDRIKRFIYEMETSPRYFIIDDLSLGSGKGENGDISLKLTVLAHFKG